MSCINVESCFWKCLSFISYVLNVLWNKWNRNKKKRDSYSIFLNFWMKPLLKNHDSISFISLTKSVSKEHPTQPAQHIWCNILLYILYIYIYINIYIYIHTHMYIYIIHIYTQHIYMKRNFSFNNIHYIYIIICYIHTYTCILYTYVLYIIYIKAGFCRCSTK